MSKRKKPAPAATAPSTQPERTLLALLNLPGIGRKTVHRLIATAGRIDAVEALLVDQASDFDKSQLAAAYKHAEAILERSAAAGIRILSYFDPNFPPLLKSIDDPPVLLHIKGDMEALKAQVGVAIIGTREPTSFGERAARKIAGAVAKRNVTVVSGLAIGCDAAAHWGCIEAGGKTVAVLAHGLDKVYPAENRSLAEVILAKAGCLVSEYEIGQRAFKTSFVDRDRLQSGLSRAVILIESGLVGGSMHTIRFAQLQHRLIACLKHPPELSGEEKVQGNVKLISEQKAVPLASSYDVDLLLSTLLDTQPEVLKPTTETPSQLSMF